MSSPGENVLREQPYTTSKTTLSLATSIQQLQKDVSYLSINEDAAAAASRRRNNVDSCRNFDHCVETILGDRQKNRKRLTLKKMESRVSEFLDEAKLNVAVVENSSISKMLAVFCLSTGKELEACCHLIESHASCLRQQILYRHVKTKLRNQILQQPLVNNLDPNDLDLDNRKLLTGPKTLLSTLEKLPTEWYVLQITSEHEQLKDLRHRFPHNEYMYALKPTHALHIVALPTGKNAMNPICITVPKPNVNSTYDICTEIEKLLNTNKTDLTTVYSNRDLYWKMRKKQNDQMGVAIWELEYSWLGEWRVLLLADYIEQLDLVEDIHNMIDKLISDASIKNIGERNIWLLKKIATGACYLRPFEIERAVKYILPTQKKLAKNIILSIVAKTKVMEPLKAAKRKPLILILDETLDHISFESMKLLKHQPVTRFPSLHILYALFKQHKSSIKDGYKIIRSSDKLGTFIVNPSLDLMTMEIRMRTFIDYWLPKWEGLYGIKPDLEFFKKAFTQYEVLMYNGHGSGIQFLSGEEIEKMRVLALVLLYGCCSIKLMPVGGRQAFHGISNQYLMACSPCILGMLWEVTDGDIDRMTAEFMSNWIPSSSKRPWLDVVQSSWNQGKLEFNKGASSQVKNEQDMLTAVAKSKDVCQHYMTSAAIVVRGLPVKLVK